MIRWTQNKTAPHPKACHSEEAAGRRGNPFSSLPSVDAPKGDADCHIGALPLLAMTAKRFRKPKNGRPQGSPLRRETELPGNFSLARFNGQGFGSGRKPGNPLSHSNSLPAPPAGNCNGVMPYGMMILSRANSAYRRIRGTLRIVCVAGGVFPV